MTRDFCPVIRAGNTLGKKWGIAIIQELHFEKKLGFNRIQKSLKKISPRVLSQSLKELESAKLVSKKPLKENMHGNFAYSLTKKGKELQLVVESLKHWSIKWGGIGTECLGQKCSECTKFCL